MKTSNPLEQGIHLDTIGVIHSCFKEKFGIPRQPGLVQEARAELELLPPYNRPEALNGLEGFSHIWVSFIFHQAIKGEWRPTVRPPRLGGNRRQGVFATRSPYRPNPLGLSVVELEAIEQRGSRPILHLKGVDLLDGTPVVDIKPYLPYSDIVPEARGGFADQAPPMEAIPIHYTEQAEAQIREREPRIPHLRTLIEEILRHDPRPAYFGHVHERRRFGMRLYDFDLQWAFENGEMTVLSLEDERVDG